MMTETARQQTRILVVGEESVTRSRMVTSLEQGGYGVVIGQDSLDALVLAQQHEPNVVVLLAPVRAAIGLEVLQSLRRRSTLSTVPMILVAADVMLVVDRGVHDAHVLKDQPQVPDQLLCHVGRLALRS
jgi:CheY-like chemotaxis protein